MRQYNGKYHFCKNVALDWMEMIEDLGTKKVAVKFNTFIPKTNIYRKEVLKCIRQRNKELYNAIVNDKVTVCLNKD